ncbi:aminodeoxychorismate synthase component I [Devosia chinhatensis]|uniref:Probable branched-chain-amino-acid aminotransferase n=1 Tax=Devosia aurantiaca TaxID=2714858 RepID=A0A6M1SMH7_9HYPH|nr:aminodeoxychorismate synthase component I [Devosia aurantiaca]
MLISGSVLLHDNLTPTGQNLLFTDPVEILVAHTAEDARSTLKRLETAGRDGLWAAGYLAYEFGFLFEERLTHLLPERSATPLLWFGLYHGRASVDVEALLSKASVGTASDIQPSQTLAQYRTAFDQVKSLIEAGDTYQVNLTFKAGFTLEGDPLGLYRTLAQSQKTAYGALIHAGDHWVLSRSPELFVSGAGDVLKARPMKGTLRRGKTLAEDQAGRAALAADAKNRAENLMIVDLLRNDLGRIAKTGSVEVTDLFTVETFSSLHTMTSGIEARKKPGIGIAEVLDNLFPCGSITGAPKLRAMEIIHEVEAGPRGLYTGSIGYIAPNGDFAFNVAIRTATIRDGVGEIGIGGGIVADSVAEEEYAEALLKLSFLAHPAPPVTLIETFKWTPEEGYVLLDRHLARLRDSAAYFALDASGAKAYLSDQAQSWTQAMRVRLTLSDAGLALTATPLPRVRPGSVSPSTRSHSIPACCGSRTKPPIAPFTTSRASALMMNLASTSSSSPMSVAS